MSDEQLKRREFIRKILMVSAVLAFVSVMILYYTTTRQAEYQQYVSDLAQEASVQSQITSLTAQNNELLAQIEASGEELVSFTEDKIKYINLASQLSQKHTVVINELTVSDVWTEGEMSGITTTIEVEGTLEAVKEFMNEYCGVSNVNRILTISCRPSGRYAWLTRTIDGDKVITWFDLTEDTRLFQTNSGTQTTVSGADSEFGLPISSGVETMFTQQYMYNPVTGRFEYILSGEEVPQEVLDETPITLEKMFADQDVKVYLVIDFLGRA